MEKSKQRLTSKSIKIETFIYSFGGLKSLLFEATKLYKAATQRPFSNETSNFITPL
jgi:hypothetical protein